MNTKHWQHAWEQVYSLVRKGDSDLPQFVHLDGDKEYKCMISKIKEIACEFTNDVKKAHIPAVLRSITKKTGQHLKESISVRHHVQTRYDPYLQVDKGWDNYRGIGD